MISGHNGKVVLVNYYYSFLWILFSINDFIIHIVYNWTTDNVVDWLVNYVHLPMYAENFRRNQFDGRMIPRFINNNK
jgi:hypothetical protein